MNNDRMYSKAVSLFAGSYTRSKNNASAVKMLSQSRNLFLRLQDVGYIHPNPDYQTPWDMARACHRLINNRLTA